MSRGPVRAVAKAARDRLDWRRMPTDTGPEAERRTIARTLAYLFGFGALLLFVTLLLPGSVDREPLPIAICGIVALVVSAVLLTAYDRVPMWALALAPALGSVIVGGVIAFAGPPASAAYALYFAWVVIAAASYLSPAATALHGAFAVAVYAIAIKVAGSGPAPAGLRVAMLAGTAAVAAIVMAELSAQARRLVARLEDDARTDPLTELENRRALREEFERELARADRGGRPLALAVCDLDHFKRYNDARGHLAGDEALRRVARILSEVTRSIEVVARIGGEEFAIVAPDTDEAGARALAERVRIAIQSEFAGSDPPLTMSAGIAVHRPGGPVFLDLFAAADDALYAAKQAGRNRVEIAAGDHEPLVLAGR